MKHALRAVGRNGKYHVGGYVSEEHRYKLVRMMDETGRSLSDIFSAAIGEYLKNYVPPVDLRVENAKLKDELERLKLELANRA